MSGVDGIFAMTIDSTRAAGLLAALVVCPLIGLGIILSVTGGAVRIERAVTALTIAMILVALALPLGGWLGIGWGEGTLSSYAALVTEVDEARAMEGFPLRFYARFLLLPVIAAIGFLLVHLKFAGALEGILLAAGLEGIDPTLELEASNVKATSLHAGGQAGHALKRVLKDGKPRAKRKKRRVSPNPAGDLPQRLI